MIPADFDCEVYTVVRDIPAGSVATYGQIARLVGMPRHARRVGAAMRCAPEGVPCHRVVASGGRLVPHWPAQRTLLEEEGIVFRPNGCADLRRSGWQLLREMQE